MDASFLRGPPPKKKTGKKNKKLFSLWFTFKITKTHILFSFACEIPSLEPGLDIIPETMGMWNERGGGG